MRRPFEPADIVKIYQERGLRVSPQFGNECSPTGRIQARLGRCCPLTACFVGAPYDEDIIRLANQRWPGFDVWSFIRGFDRTAWGPTNKYTDLDQFDPVEYQLGVDTAKLLRKHKFLDP